MKSLKDKNEAYLVALILKHANILIKNFAISCKTLYSIFQYQSLTFDKSLNTTYKILLKPV